ncbi:MAG: hypothetical protein EXR14_06415 [Pelagibacteraceae bacterium]|nr:hypothetical protein [Pelagibacteraceae bacterium]
MKNKITTALVGTLFGLGLNSAIAQTTVSGNLNIAYNAVTPKVASGDKNSYRTTGQETQINIQNKGTLNNGMAYAAGFSWEIDGNEALGDSTAGSASDSSNGRNENTYIDLYVTKDTYISISSDHIPNSDVTMTNLVGWGYLGAQGVHNATTIYPASFNDSGYGLGVVSNLGPATFAIGFQPNPGKAGGSSDSGHNIKQAEDSVANSKIEATLRGNMNVKGLDVLVSAAMQKAEKINVSGAQVDPNGRRAAAKYNFGDVTVAADYIRLAGQNRTPAGGTATTTQEHTLTGKSAAIAYALSPNASVGYTRSEGKTSVAGTETEKVHMFAVGYNLGAVAVQAQYRDGKGIAGQTGDTGVGNVTQVMISTKF